jgi:transposase
VIEQRRAFAQQVAEKLSRVLARLRFIDECGMHLGLTRLYGRAAPGERVVEATPGYSGPHYTLVASLSLTGVQAPWAFEKAMNTQAFETYVEHILGPTLQAGDIVVVDNLSAHKGKPVQRLIEARGAQVVFLPPYSPDLNPIEKCWAKVKAALRRAKARTWDVLLEALADALRSVSAEDALAWFKHCGYVSA